MCTLSWHEQPDGYQLFFNRDERRDRKAASPPSVRRRGAMRFVAPLDGNFGGTWLAVNQCGVSLALLNGLPGELPETDGAQPAEPDPAEYTTRGMVPIALIDSTTAVEAADRLADMALHRFRPFVLLALDPGGRAMLAGWTGDELELRDGVPSSRPVISSSFFTEEVRRSRMAVFRKMADAAPEGDPTDLHLQFHTSHDPAAGPYSPCMHRPDACTVSFSWISVEADGIRFRYSGQSPCRGLPEGTTSFLARIEPGVRIASSPALSREGSRGTSSTTP